MPARTAMKMRCQVQREVDTDRRDAFNQKITEQQTVTDSVFDLDADGERTEMPCYAQPRSERYVTQDAKVLTVAIHTMLAPRKADLRSGDVVLNVRDKSGYKIVPNKMLVASVIRREDHQELVLEEIA